MGLNTNHICIPYTICRNQTGGHDAGEFLARAMSFGDTSYSSPSSRKAAVTPVTGNKFTSNQDNSNMSALHFRSIQGNREHEKKRDIRTQGAMLLRERQTSEDASMNNSGFPAPETSHSPNTPEYNRHSPRLLDTYASINSVHSLGSTGSLPHLHNGLTEVQENEQLQEAALIKKQYKERLLEIAELENDRTLLQYKATSLQDCLDDKDQEIRECRELNKRQCSEVLQMKQQISALQSEKESLHAQVQYRDEFLDKHNLVLPYIGPDGELVETRARNFADLLRDKEEELEVLKREKEDIKQELQTYQEKQHLERDNLRETGRNLTDLRQKLKQLESENLAAKNTISSKDLVISKKMQHITELDESESKLREERRDLFSKNRQLVYENDELLQTTDILQARIKRLNQSQMRTDV